MPPLKTNSNAHAQYHTVVYKYDVQCAGMFHWERYLKTESLKTAQMNFSEELYVVRHQQNRLSGNFWKLPGRMEMRTFRSVEAFLLFWLRRVWQRLAWNCKQITGETCAANWISHGTCQRTLQNFNSFPYKAHVMYQLLPQDCSKWAHYCEWLLEKERTNFTAKAWFYPSGRVNSQNDCIWQILV
jgi:hypothetical protein